MSTHLLLINPNTSPEVTADVAESARRVVSPGTVVTAVNPEHGPAVIDGAYDKALATYGLVEEMQRAEREEDYDADVIACFGDPGLDAAKELTDKPVGGNAEAAIMVPASLGPGLSAVSTLPRAQERVRRLAELNGAGARLASVRTTDLGVLAFHEDPEGTLDVLEAAGAEAIREDGAEVLVLGCAGMTGLAGRLSERLGVPVVDPVEAASRVAESLVALRYSTSKANTYQAPTEKVYR